jgi:uncharacterized Zn finger protein
MPPATTTRATFGSRPASRTSFGRTWWGAQWLQALTQIDHENRLPRGRTYANRGAVLDLDVQERRVRARVQGSRARPYDVDIEVPATPAADAARLIECLAADAGLIGRLLNRELDPAVLQEARRLAIPVFPSRWSELKMHCSCPDWAVPCKHLAAVIYLLSQEIDGDPFLVFRLRGLDLPGLLQEQGVHIGADAVASPPSLSQAFFEETPAAAQQGIAAPRGDPSTLERLDFTTIPDLREPLWQVLPANPVFFRAGDFREVARRAMALVARHARQVMQAAVPPNDSVPMPEGRVQLVADDHGGLAVTGVEQAGRALETLPELLQAVASVAPARLPDLPVELAALHTVRLMALHLLAQGAVVPQVFAIPANTLGVRWCAAELDGTVHRMLAQVASALPPHLVLRRCGRKTEPLAPSVQMRLLLSTLLDHFVQSAGGASAEKPPDDKVLVLFFEGGRASFDGPGEGAIGGSIHAWLARLHLARQAHAPVLRIEDDEDDAAFALSIAVAEDAAMLQAPTPLAKVLSAPAWASRRLALLQTVAMLAEFHPPLNDYVRQGARKPLALEPQDLPHLLFDTLPALRLMGIRTLLPRGLDRLLRPRPSMQIKAKSSSASGFLKADALFSFDWKVSFGDERITPAEFERLLGKARGIVRFRGQYVYLDPAEIEQLRARLARPAAVSGSELLRVALAGEVDGAPVGLNKAAETLIEQLTSTADVPLPAGLRATLRPYQERGYAWLWRNARLGLGSVIADDMGLGKTLQVIALLPHGRGGGRALLLNHAAPCRTPCRARVLTSVTCLVTRWWTDRTEIGRWMASFHVLPCGRWRWSVRDSAVSTSAVRRGGNSASSRVREVAGVQPNVG